MPTTAQLRAETQDRPLNSGSLTPAGRGAARSVNVVPFQATATGVSVPLLIVMSVESPMATQEVSEKQCRPVYCVIALGSASGTVVRAHLVPFQVQMMLLVTLVVSLIPTPMTTQLLTATQDTEVTWPSVCAGIGGAAIGVSAVPFQVSANGTTPAVLVSASPSARQYVAALHDTPPSRLNFAPLGALTGTAFQVPACSRAANAVKLCDLLFSTACSPTDRQAVGDAQEIAIPTVSSVVVTLACGRAAASRSRDDAAMRPAALPAGYLAATARRKAASAVLPPAGAAAVPVGSRRTRPGEGRPGAAEQGRRRDQPGHHDLAHVSPHSQGSTQQRTRIPLAALSKLVVFSNNLADCRCCVPEEPVYRAC